MAQTFDLIVRGGTVVNQDGAGPRDVGIREGRIAAVGSLGASDAGEVIDVAGLHVLPGVIDPHTHMREPGSEHKEDLESGSRAAVLGGVTSVFEMPNTDPTTTSGDALADKIARARHRMFCDFGFYVGATRENTDELGDLERLPGCCGVKVFMGSSTGTLLVDDDEGVARILSVISRRASFHSEDEDRLNARRGERRDGDPSSHPVWRDPVAAVLCTERLMRLARAAGKRVHVLHVATMEEMPILAANKDVASCEVTPHHLSLGDPQDYARLGTLAQINPPVRDAAQRAGIWAGLASGVVDTIGSDHAPHALEEKVRPYPASPSGMPGVQTLVPVMLDHVAAGRLTIERFVDLTAHGPARIYQIAAKGRLAEGYDADLTIVDVKARRTITNGWIASKCGWTPYDGREVTGWPVGTIVRGRKVMWEGEVLGEAAGETVRFTETL